MSRRAQLFRSISHTPDVPSLSLWTNNPGDVQGNLYSPSGPTPELYRLHYSATDDQFSSYDETLFSAAGDFNLALPPGVTWYFRVRAERDERISAWTEVQSLTVTPISAQQTAIAGDQVMVTWSPIPGADSYSYAQGTNGGVSTTDTSATVTLGVEQIDSFAVYPEQNNSPYGEGATITIYGEPAIPEVELTLGQLEGEPSLNYQIDFTGTYYSGFEWSLGYYNQLNAWTEVLTGFQEQPVSGSIPLAASPGLENQTIHLRVSTRYIVNDSLWIHSAVVESLGVDTGAI